MAGGRQAELNARLIAELDCSRSAAIDGPRHAIDFDSLSRTFGALFQIIFLEVRPEIRFERLRSGFSAYESFEAADSAPVEMHVDGLKALASSTISNETSLENLHQQLDAWAAACGIGDGK